MVGYFLFWSDLWIMVNDNIVAYSLFISLPNWTWGQCQSFTHPETYHLPLAKKCRASLFAASELTTSYLSTISLLIFLYPGSGEVNRKRQETGECMRIHTLVATALFAVAKWRVFWDNRIQLFLGKACFCHAHNSPPPHTRHLYTPYCHIYEGFWIYDEQAHHEN